MANGDVHTVPSRNGWTNKVEGDWRTWSTHETEIAARKRGRDMAILRKVQHLIHNQDGSVRERASYRNDARRRSVSPKAQPARQPEISA